MYRLESRSRSRPLASGVVAGHSAVMPSSGFRPFGALVVGIAVSVGAAPAACSSKHNDFTPQGDGATGDDARVPDGGADAPGCTPVATPNATFCEAQGDAHVFCADFDRSAVDKNWTSIVSQPPASVALDPCQYKSPPYSFAAAAPASTSDTSARLLRTFSTPGVEGHLRFDFFVDALAPAGGPVAEVDLQPNVSV